jgi:hypothetical protein
LNEINGLLISDSILPEVFASGFEGPLESGFSLYQAMAKNAELRIIETVIVM